MGRLTAAFVLIATLLAAPVQAAGTTTAPAGGDDGYGSCLSAEIEKDDGALSADKAAVRIVLTCTGANHCKLEACRHIDIDDAADKLAGIIEAVRHNPQFLEDCATEAAVAQAAINTACMTITQQ